MLPAKLVCSVCCGILVTVGKENEGKLAKWHQQKNKQIKHIQWLPAGPCRSPQSPSASSHFVNFQQHSKTKKEKRKKNRTCCYRSMQIMHKGKEDDT